MADSVPQSPYHPISVVHMDSDKLKGCPFPHNNYLSPSTLLKENALLYSCTITLSLPHVYLDNFINKVTFFRVFFAIFSITKEIFIFQALRGFLLHWFVVPVGFFSWKAWYGNDPRDTSITLDGRKVCCVCVQYRKSPVADSWLVIG